MAKQDVTVELFYDSQWNDHTDTTLTRDGIAITRGRQDETQQPRPTSANLTLSGWEFNPHNPISELFGLIGRNTPLRITVDGETRFTGEVSNWTPRQSLGDDNVEPDRWVEVVAAGITRRLKQGQDPLRNTVHRYITSGDGATGLVGYWPLHDPEGSRRGRAVVGNDMKRAGVPPALGAASALPNFGQGSLAPWLPRSAQLTSEQGAIRASLAGTTSGGWIAEYAYKSSRSAQSLPIPNTIIMWSSDGGDGSLEFRLVFGAADDIIGIIVLDQDDNILADITDDPGDLFDGQMHHVRFEAQEASGDNVNLFGYIDGSLTIALAVDIGVSTTPAAGAVEMVWTDDTDATAPVSVGQVAVWNQVTGGPGVAETFDVYFGRQGEHAGRRIERLCDEQGVAFTFDGDLDDTLPCGPQYPDGFMAILRDAAQVDLGDLLDARSSSAVLYRTGRSRYNRLADMQLNYSSGQIAPPLDPVVDDQGSRNDVTASRRDGGQVRRVDEDGPLGVDAIGRYDASISVNTLSDGHDLASQAGWRLHLGTVEGTRFPKVSIDLVATTNLGSSIDLDAGQRLRLNVLPDALSPDSVDLLVLGYTERIGSHRRNITYNCTPEEPYHIAEVEHDDYAVIGSDGTRRNPGSGDIDENSTFLTMQILNGYFWTAEDLPVDILVGGERMRVVAIDPPSGDTQLFEVVRSVNGVVKSHPNDVAVQLFHRSYIGL